MLDLYIRDVDLDCAHQPSALSLDITIEQSQPPWLHGANEPTKAIGCGKYRPGGWLFREIWGDWGIHVQEPRKESAAR